MYVTYLLPLSVSLPLPLPVAAAYRVAFPSISLLLSLTPLPSGIPTHILPPLHSRYPIWNPSCPLPRPIILQYQPRRLSSWAVVQTLLKHLQGRSIDLVTISIHSYQKAYRSKPLNIRSQSTYHESNWFPISLLCWRRSALYVCKMSYLLCSRRLNTYVGHPTIVRSVLFLSYKCMLTDISHLYYYSLQISSSLLHSVGKLNNT